MTRAEEAPVDAQASTPSSEPDWLDLQRSQLVRDPADAGATGALARRLGELDRIVRVALAPGENRPLGALGMAILQALGKDLDLTPALRQQDAWRLAKAWLEAEDTRALIVIGPEQFTEELWEEIDDVRRYQRARVVILVSHQTGEDSPRRQPGHAERCFDRVDAASLHRWAARFTAAYRPADAVSKPPPPRYPAVPDDEAPYFRAACRAVLTAPEFARVNRSYRRGHDITRRWLTGRDDVSEEEASDHLAEALLWINDVHERLTRLRGAQIAFLHHRWLLKVDLEAFSVSHAIQRPSDIDTQIAARLRAYPQPKLSALAALAIATGLSPANLAVLNADQIFPNDDRHLGSCNAIYYGDEYLPIESGARPFLRAHHADRNLRRQPPDGPLFTTTAGRRLAAAAIQQQLRRISQDTGLPLLSSPTTGPHDPLDGHWMRRSGITLQPL